MCRGESCTSQSEERIADGSLETARNGRAADLLPTSRVPEAWNQSDTGQLAAPLLSTFARYENCSRTPLVCWAQNRSFSHTQLLW